MSRYRLPVQATGPLESLATVSSPAFPAPVPASVIPKLAARRRVGRVAGRGLLAVGLGSLIAISFLIYGGLCLYMAIKLTTPVRREITRTPDQYGLAYDTVRFPSRDDALDLEGWLVKPAAPAAAPASAGASPAGLRPVVMVHGRNSNRQEYMEGRALELAQAMAQQGRHVLLFDLRGHGRSAGTRFTLGAQEVRDLGGAIDYLEQRSLVRPAEGVTLMGFSMGAATVLLHAPHDPRVRAVIEDSGYAELGEVLSREIPKASGLPGFFTPGVVLAAQPLAGKNGYDIRPIAGLPRLVERGVPLFVIHGEKDTLILPEHGRRLAAAYGAGAETLYVAGAGHLGAYLADSQTYLSRLTQFLSRTG